MKPLKLKKQRIKQYLKENHIYQKELAGKINEDPTTFSHYVCGTRLMQLPKAYHLSQVTGIKFDELFEYEDPKEARNKSRIERTNTEVKKASKQCCEEKKLEQTIEAEGNEPKPVDQNKTMIDRLCNYLNSMPKVDKYARFFLFLFAWYFVMTQCPFFSRGLDEPLFWPIATVVSFVILMANRHILKKEYEKSKNLAE